ncbi:MAG: asparaginase [Cytophagales bacterium]|nr:asparaginase [Cytophagales bacterium]
MIGEEKGIERGEGLPVNILYTGGTFGMRKDLRKAEFLPLSHILKRIPEVREFNMPLRVFSWDRPMDSSHMIPEDWIRISRHIRKYYEESRGFLILHGTDSLSYTASMLSHILRPLRKAILLTGAQVPLEASRSDARQNLLSSLEILKEERIRSEVAICFQHLLLRGNRSTKVDTTSYASFQSPRFPPLAHVGVDIEYKSSLFLPPAKDHVPPQTQDACETQVMLIKIFPGMEPRFLIQLLKHTEIKGLLFETLGAGHMLLSKSLNHSLKSVQERGSHIAHVSQATRGKVKNSYAAAQPLSDLGVVGCKDMTTEAALTKMMFLLGNNPNLSAESFSKHMTRPWAGECSKD